MSLRDRPLYGRWRNMLSRCTNPNASGYQYYGGRGIRVCERWLNYENFEADMGVPDDLSLTLDRIDPNGDYEPDNCRWATRSEQQRNTRVTLMATLDGVTKPLVEWAETLGLNYTTVACRVLKDKMTPEEALTKPIERSTSEPKVERTKQDRVFASRKGFHFEAIGGSEKAIPDSKTVPTNRTEQKS